MNPNHNPKNGQFAPKYGVFFKNDFKNVLNALYNRNSKEINPSCYRGGFKKAFELYKDGKDFQICFGNYDYKKENDVIGHMWLADINDENKLIFECRGLKNKERNFIDSIKVNQIDGYDEDELQDYIEDEIKKHDKLEI